MSSSIPCSDCNGRGKWSEPINEDDYQGVVWKVCNTCGGTGESQNDEDQDDFDINSEEDE